MTRARRERDGRGLELARACVPPPLAPAPRPAGGPYSPAVRTRIDTACQPLHRGAGRPPSAAARSRRSSLAARRPSLVDRCTSLHLVARNP